MVGTIVTTKGRMLIAKMVAMEGCIRFTRAAVGTGNIPKGYDPGYLSDLNQYRMDGKITGTSSSQETASITFQIASKDVEEGFVITEAGLYAEDPDEGEILYAYLDMEEDPQYIYPKGGDINKVAEITLGVIIGQVERVTAMISPGGLITKEQFEKLEQKTDACKTKLDGIEEGANRYVHPETHPAGIITEDAAHRFVSDMEKKVWDDTYRQSTAYTDEKIADLINGAPETLDTLGEIAEAMKENEDVVEALNAAIGSKANEAEFDSHKKETEKLLGNTDISAIGDGTVTGAINELNTGIFPMAGSGNYQGHICSHEGGLAVFINIPTQPPAYGMRYNVTCTRAGVYGIGWSQAGKIQYVTSGHQLLIVIPISGQYADAGRYLGHLGTAELVITCESVRD